MLIKINIFCSSFLCLSGALCDAKNNNFSPLATITRKSYGKFVAFRVSTSSIEIWKFTFPSFAQQNREAGGKIYDLTLSLFPIFTPTSHRFATESENSPIPIYSPVSRYLRCRRKMSLFKIPFRRRGTRFADWQENATESREEKAPA